MPPTLGLRTLTLAVVLFALGNALWSAWDQGWTYDESFHLQWSRRLLESGVTERDSQQRLNSKTPVTLVNVACGKLAAALGVTGVRGLRFAQRLPSVLWLALLLAAAFSLARSHFGESAGLLATIGVGLDPNLAAHGSLATVDVAFALATLLVIAAGLRLASAPSPKRGAVLGLALGFAFATKFTAALFLPVLLLLPFALGQTHDVQTRRVFRAFAAALVVAGAVVLAFLAAAYLFREIALPLSSQRWASAPMRRMAQALPGLRLPLPASFLTGFDRSLALEQEEWNVILLGQRHPRGVWYYFAFLWLVKTPVLLLIAQLVGLVRAARTWLLLRSQAARSLGVHGLLFLGYFSLLFQAQIGYRFVLMCVPIVSILAAAALAPLLAGAAWRKAAIAVLMLSLLESVPYFGNPLAFTNAAVWPKRLAFRLIADSNIDWGQNREKIDGWLVEQSARLEPLHMLPGPNVIGLNAVAGVWDFERHRWLREHLNPKRHLGHTYLLFDITGEAFDRFLGETRRLAPTPGAEDACGTLAEVAPLGPGARIPFAISEKPDPEKIWRCCVAAKGGVDFALRATSGRILFGTGVNEKALTLVEAGQVSWYRLDPGVHTLFAAEIANRRDWLPYAFEGVWMIRGHAAALRVSQISRSQGPAVPGSSKP